MKKRFLFVLLFMLAVVCFSSLNDNDLKACSTNTAHCSALVKKPVKNMSPEYVEYAEPVFIHLMNPFISM